MARAREMESLTFIKDSAAAWFGKFDCPYMCPHKDLKAFCRKYGYTDCYGALMRFLLSED
jgi:hypothetical protein